MGDINLKAALGGQIVLTPTNTASNYTVTIPAVTGTMSVQSAASFTQGSVIFAGASGVYAQDNANFFWDDTNNYLGVGTSSPSQKLHIYGNILCDSASATNIYAQSSGVTYTQFQTTSSATTLKTIPANPLIFGTNDTEKMRIASDGSVGIGTTSPSYKLDVNGSIRAQASLLVNTSYSTAWTPNTSSGQIYIQNTYALNNSTALFQCTTLYGDSTTTGVQFGAVATNSYSADFIVANRNGGTYQENLRLTAAGNLGLGAAASSWGSAQKAIQVNTRAALASNGGNTSLGNNWYNNGTNNTYIATAAASLYEQTAGTHNWYYAPSGSGTITFTQAMTLDASGNLLVGTTNSSNTVGNGFKYIPSTNQVSQVVSAAVNTYTLYNTTAGAYRFFVSDAGVINATSTTITGISDVRFKENIRDLDDGLEKLLSLKPRKFDWKKNKGADTKDARGFIAQEFEQVFPDMIVDWLDPAPEGEEPYKAINANLIPTLVKAIQELSAKLDAAEARIASLEGAK